MSPANIRATDKRPLLVMSAMFLLSIGLTLGLLADSRRNDTPSHPFKTVFSRPFYYENYL